MERVQAPTQVWATLRMKREDEARIRHFFLAEKVPESCIAKGLHLTVYHARRPIPTLPNVRERVREVVWTEDTRFMILAPGGENPRPELDPAKHKVGIRIRRKSSSREPITAFRSRMLTHETTEIIGSRKRSTQVSNAFGARHFQPHITLLKRAPIERDLTALGERFRSAFSVFTFDQFQVRQLTDFPIAEVKSSVFAPVDFTINRILS